MTIYGSVVLNQLIHSQYYVEICHANNYQVYV